MLDRRDPDPTPASDENPKNFVASVVKAFAVLKAFDASLPELTVTEVATRAGLDRGTSFRLINTLCHLGYLAPVPRSRRYRLTLKCLELGYQPLASADLKKVSRPLLAEAVPDVADAASLGVLDGPDVVYVERVQSEFANLNLDRRPGSRTGAYGAALGHVLLAGLPPERQRAILEGSNRIRTSEKTLVEIDAIMERLVQVRERGYAVSDGENAYGLRTVAAAVLDTQGLPVAGVSLTIHQDRADMDAFVKQAVPVVRHIADELTRALRLSFGSISTQR